MGPALQSLARNVGLRALVKPGDYEVQARHASIPLRLVVLRVGAVAFALGAAVFLIRRGKEPRVVGESVLVKAVGESLTPSDLAFLHDESVKRVVLGPEASA